MENVRTFKIETGTKIYCEGQKHAYKMNDILQGLGAETRIGYNEAGIWSIYIVSMPDIINK